MKFYFGGPYLLGTLSTKWILRVLDTTWSILLLIEL